jgi:hypothetical protein
VARFKIEFITRNEQHVERTVCYKVGSSLELFDRLMRLRNLFRLRSVCLIGVRKAKGFFYLAHANPKDFHIYKPYHVKLSDLTTPEALESLAVNLWQFAAPFVGSRNFDYDFTPKHIYM